MLTCSTVPWHLVGSRRLMSQVWSVMWPQLSHPTNLCFIVSSFPSHNLIINFDVMPSRRDCLSFFRHNSRDFQFIWKCVVADTHTGSVLQWAVVAGGLRAIDLPYLSIARGDWVCSWVPWQNEVCLHKCSWFYFLPMSPHHHSLITTEFFTNPLSLRKGKLGTIGLLGSFQPHRVYCIIVVSH